jgi:hypothetical protein
MVGVLKKNEKSLEILLNSKLPNFILYLESRIEVKSESWFFDSINK